MYFAKPSSRKAFTGQLVPQDPDDEPAAVLLEAHQSRKSCTISRQHAGKTKTHGGNGMTGKLPVNVNHLLRQRTIEGERIEYKAGWNPQTRVAHHLRLRQRLP